jgi:acyl-CoA thioesterase-1
MMIRKISLLLIYSVVLTAFACTSETEEKAAIETKVVESTVPAEKPTVGTIVFFGNSLTAGYGVDPTEAFAGLTQQKIDSLNLKFQVINAGVSGETTASGLSRVEWVVKRQKVDIFILELGGNDGLRGINPVETDKNLRAIIDKVESLHPNVEIILAGMMVPPNMGADYGNQFKALFPLIAKEKSVTLIPFLLKDVGGIKELNLPDGIHPTPEGHKIVAETVWEYLMPKLKE